jgi:ABC-2 type transport system permease protein
MIFKIARTELRNLFYSPVAWFLTIVFMIQCAVFYTTPLAMGANWQELLLKNNPNFKDWGEQSMTLGMFLGQDGIFMNVMQNLYLFVPLLTMGLISREINNGTIKLLYSSPVKVREIVLGKFLAIMIYNAVLLSVVGFFMVSGAFNIRAVDYGMLLSAALGFYLMLCAYTAIGMFMSSLSTYQIVSAISTFVTIFILSRIGGLWQKYDFVRDLTYFLSLSGRTGKMLRGLITTKDLVYFLAVIYMFMGFTYLKLAGGRESAPWYRKVLRFTVVVVTALTVGYITSRPTLVGYWDTTAAQINTIHPSTQKNIKDLGKDPVEVTLYTNILGGGVSRGLPEGRNAYIEALWEPYIRFKPEIDLKYVNYYDYDSEKDSFVYRSFPHKSLKEIAGILADGMGADVSKFQPGEELHKTIDLRAENYRVVMQLKYKGQSVFLRTFDDNRFWPDEQQVNAAVRRLIDGTLPKVRYITGDLERNIDKSGEREFQYHSSSKNNRSSLINNGFDIDTLSLDYQDIPADVKILVLADPKSALSAASLDKLRQYIDKGGNMLILGEPGKQQMLNPMLQQLGVRLTEGTLVEVTKNEMPHMIRPYVTKFGLNLADEAELRMFRDVSDTLKTTMPGAVGVEHTNDSLFAATTIMMAMPQTWLKAGKLVVDSTPPEFMPQEGDRTGAFQPMIALTRKVHNSEQRIIVGGDADVMSNLRGGGAGLGRALYSWLDDNHFPVYTPRPNPADNLLSISSKGAKALEFVYVWILPALVLLIGILLLIRRKRK